MYWKELMHQCVEIGIGSLGIVGYYLGVHGSGERRSNILPAGESAHSPTTIAQIVRDTVILEFAPPWFVLYWRVWWAARSPASSAICGYPEQIDAPRSWASIPNPPPDHAQDHGLPHHHSLLVILHGFSIYGGRPAGVATKILSADTYDQGLLLNFCSLQRILCTGKSTPLHSS